MVFPLLSDVMVCHAACGATGYNSAEERGLCCLRAARGGCVLSWMAGDRWCCDSHSFLAGFFPSRLRCKVESAQPWHSDLRPLPHQEIDPGWKGPSCRNANPARYPSAFWEQSTSANGSCYISETIYCPT